MTRLPMVLVLVSLLAALAMAEEAAPGAPQPQSLLSSPLWDIFTRGGVCMWVILFTAILGAAFTVERRLALRRGRHAPKDFEKDVVHIVDLRGVDAGLALCVDKPSSLARVLHAALLRHGTARQELETAVTDEASRVRYDLRRKAHVVGLAGLVALSSGLAGTAFGLVEAFDRTAADGSLESLAGGVAAALLPTAFGLLAALPLACAFLYLRAIADDLVRDIDERGKDAVVTLDRKARQSIRLIEDIDERVPTKDMPAVKEPPPELAKEFEVTAREGSGVKTSITTPVNLPTAAPPPTDQPKKP